MLGFLRLSGRLGPIQGQDMALDSLSDICTLSTKGKT